MTPQAEVALSILDSRFRITSEDERMPALVGELWAPFVADAVDDAHEVAIEVRRASCYVRMPGERPFSGTDPWVVAASLRNALSRRAIAEATGIVPLHAAAVERDGTVVVLSGPPRVGKTTLLLDLLDRGWLLVTDDLVPLDPATLTATPFPKPLSVREPDRWLRFSGGWEVPGWLPAPIVAGLLPATVFPGTALERYTPAAIVFPQFTAGARPRIERLTPAGLVARAADNLHTHLPAVPVLPAFARLAAVTAGFSIEYGSSDEAVDLVEKGLAAAWRME